MGSEGQVRSPRARSEGALVSCAWCLEARAARSDDNKRERRPAHATARRHCTPARPPTAARTTAASVARPADRRPQPSRPHAEPSTVDFIVWNPPSSTAERVCLALAKPPLSPSPTQPGPRSCLQFAVRNRSCHFPTRRFCLDTHPPLLLPSLTLTPTHAYHLNTRPASHHAHHPPLHPPLNTPRPRPRPLACALRTPLPVYPLALPLAPWRNRKPSLLPTCNIRHHPLPTSTLHSTRHV
jgi:hypothetical protein